MNEAKAKKLLTKGQVAEMFGVSERTVNRWIASGKLKAVRIGYAIVRFDMAAVDTFRRRHGGV